LSDVRTTLRPGDRPIAALYAGDEDGQHLVRVAISDVAYLHELRDDMLTGQFALNMKHELDKSSKTPGATWAALDVSADTSHFAVEYEDSIMRLDKLTPHQTVCLRAMHPVAAVGTMSTSGCRGWHLKAAAGAGKTFVALHLMLETIDGGSQALFVAANQALTVFVAKWLALRIKGYVKGFKKQCKLLARLHVMSAESAEPCGVTIGKVSGAIEAGAYTRPLFCST